MLFQEVSLLVTCLFTAALGIRVDWGTNKGPIVPPTPRPVVVPLPPYRQPAPVWEDQSNDIPNPNPYVYVPPPPSRPRYNNPDNNYNLHLVNYGMLVPPAPARPATNAWNSYYQPRTSTVASLAPKYVPGVGIQYYAVIPKPTSHQPATSVSYYSEASDKLQGKYNAKTKKHKVYEKVKPASFNKNNDYHKMTTKSPQVEEQSSQGSQYEIQQLPISTAPQAFQQSSWNTAPNSATTASKLAWKWKKEQQKREWSKFDNSNAPNAILS